MNVEILRCQAIVGDNRLADLKSHAIGIIVAFELVVGRHCEHVVGVPALQGDRLAQVVREGGDSAFAGKVIGDKGYDSDEFRDALEARKIKACTRSNRIAPRSYSKILYKQRHKIENMFAKLKDWRRITTIYDRCAHTFMPAICIAATVIFPINQ